MHVFFYMNIKHHVTWVKESVILYFGFKIDSLLLSYVRKKS